MVVVGVLASLAGCGGAADIATTSSSASPPTTVSTAASTSQTTPADSAGATTPAPVDDDKFEELVKAWPAEHENENVDRATFTTWVNDKTGRDFTPLVDRWLDSPRTPRPS